MSVRQCTCDFNAVPKCYSQLEVGDICYWGGGDNVQFADLGYSEAELSELPQGHKLYDDLCASGPHFASVGDCQWVQGNFYFSLIHEVTGNYIDV